MARGGLSPGPPALPVVSFAKVEDEFSSKRLSVPEQPIRSYGYNDGSDFKRPEHYIRYIEPLESELAVQVEYDMDEQDQQWLDALNAERRSKNLGSVPYEVFEIVMDRLEKEWFDLTKNIPKPDLAMPSEDSTCAICDDSEGENTNAIVFCDGCNLAVHQDCYGVPYIPEGQWLCRKCTVSPENPVSCILCPNEGGAFKQTMQGEWVHLLCAIWVPETRVANDVFMEPVTGVDRISKQRWKLKCSICDIREGACIQCTKSSCFLAFHATCARKEKLLMPMKSAQGSEAPTLACYCEKHLPKEQVEARTAALVAEHCDTALTDAQAAKTARAYAKTYKPGPPLVPAIIVRRLEQYIARLSVRQKREFIVLVCKYWSLKREARRGAPLLKRLHLEPWTASAGGRAQSDEDKAIKLEFMKRVREDLEALRNLALLCRKRESRKLYQQEVVQRVISHFLLAKQPFLRMAFETIMAYDKSGYFKEPVSKAEVPDYYDIIKDPICWNTIDEKLDRYEYWDLQSFKDDIYLVLHNAMIYNKADTAYWKTAQRIKNAAETVFADLEKRICHMSSLSSVSTNGSLEPEGDSMPVPQTVSSSDPYQYPHHLSSIGDIEPSFDMLELLLAQEFTQNDRDMRTPLDKLPIEALFSYELAVPSPLTSAPMPALAPSGGAPAAAIETQVLSLPAAGASTADQKPKRDRKAEKERRAERERRRLLQQQQSPIVPRTRRGWAVVAAFEAEVVAAGGGAAAGSEGPSLTAEPEQMEGIALQSVAQQPSADPEASTIATTAPTSAKRKHKRPTITLPGQTEVPPVVEDVDNQQSFKMFDGGWILPNDQRRHGRPPIEKVVSEPRKKKTRTGDREKSQMSMSTTTGTAPGGETPSQAFAAMELVVDEQQEGASGQGGMMIVDGMPEMHESPRPMTGSPVAALAEDTVNISNVVIPLQYRYDEMHVDIRESHEGTDIADILGEEAQTQAEAGVAGSEPRNTEDLEPEEDEGPPRIIIIEELDTPATRREKNMRKKAERARLAAETAATSQHAHAQAGEQEEQRSIIDADINVDASMDVDSLEDDVGTETQSELTSLSSLHDDEYGEDAEMEDERGVMSGSLTPIDVLTEAGETDIVGEDVGQSPSADASAIASGSGSWSTKQALKSKKRLRRDSEKGKLKYPKGRRFLEGGTLVWAKLQTYPWWPAVVFEPDDSAVDPDVLERKTPQEIRKHRLHLVRFYDNKDYWEWLDPSKLKMLGDDKELDADMLASSSSIQKWKNSRTREAIRTSFRRAVAEMEAPSIPGTTE